MNISRTENDQKLIFVVPDQDLDCHFPFWGDFLIFVIVHSLRLEGCRDKDLFISPQKQMGLVKGRPPDKSA